MADTTQKGTECRDKNRENHCLLDQQKHKTTEDQKGATGEIKGKPEGSVLLKLNHEMMLIYKGRFPHT